MICPWLGGQCVKEDCALWKPVKQNIFPAECSIARIPSALDDIANYLSDIAVDGIDTHISGLVTKDDRHQ